MSTISNLIWSNLSILPENVVNDSSDLSENNVTQPPDNRNITTFLVCSLGVPGNVLVIIVYIVNMKTSTRVYMFALALADLAVCLCGIFLTAIKFATVVILIYFISVSINFSVVLLVFVSIERLLAVKRPHTFSNNTRRAKRALIIICVAAAIFTSVSQVAFNMGYKSFCLALEISLISICTIVMVICYTLIAIGLLKKVCASRNQIGNENATRLPQPGCSSAVLSHRGDTARSTNLGPLHTCTKATQNEQNSATMKPVPSAVTNKTTVKQANNYKNMFLLFVITFVFVVCWMPTWLNAFGVSVTFEVTRMYVVNSVVNPFIYGVASAMFREDVRQFYRQTRAKLSACCH